MSTCFVTDQPINMATLSQFHHQGVWVDSTEEGRLILTDGTNYLYAGTCPGIYTVRIDPADHAVEMDYSHDYHGILFTCIQYHNKKYPAGRKPAFKDDRSQSIGTL